MRAMFTPPSTQSHSSPPSREHTPKPSERQYHGPRLLDLESASSSSSASVSHDDPTQTPSASSLPSTSILTTSGPTTAEAHRRYRSLDQDARATPSEHLGKSRSRDSSPTFEEGSSGSNIVGRDLVSIPGRGEQLLFSLSSCTSYFDASFHVTFPITLLWIKRPCARSAFSRLCFAAAQKQFSPFELSLFCSSLNHSYHHPHLSKYTISSCLFIPHGYRFLCHKSPRCRFYTSCPSFLCFHQKTTANSRLNSATHLHSLLSHPLISI